MNPNQITFKGVIIWLVCALFFMYEFLLRTVLGTFQYPIMQDLYLSPVKFALLSSTAYQITYGLMQLPVGIIVDRFGLKRTLFCAVITCGIANVGFALTHHFNIAFIFRFLMGLGSSFGFVCLLVAVYEWMPRKNIALFIGLSQFIGTLGPMLAAGPLNTLSEANTISWRSFFILSAIVAVFIALLVLLVVENKRETTGKFLILNRTPDFMANLIRLLKQKQIWFIAIFSASIYFSIEYLSENEGTAFLMSKGFSSTFSAYMITISWLGYAVCCPLLGYVSDKIQQRIPIMIASASILVFALIGIFYLPLGNALTTVCFFLVGLGASAQSIGFATIAEYCKESYLAVGLAFNNAMITVCAGMNAPLIGLVLSYTSDAKFTKSLTAYQEAFSIMIGLALIALLLSIFAIKETFCKSMRENTRLTVTLS